MTKINDKIVGELRMNASGSAYLVNNDLPKDIYIHKKHTNKGLHLDEVMIEVIPGKNSGIEGKVVDVLKSFKTKFVGTLQVTDRFAFLVPDSPKMVTDIFIPLSKLNGGEDGQKAVGEITNWKDGGKNPNGKIIEVLGDAGDNDTEIHSILHEYGLPYNFDEDVEAESEAIPLEIVQSEIDKRRDMRNILTFTIDPDTAKDFDDALSVEWVDGKMQVGIHIADVSHYVRPGTSLDKEAYERGTSVYLVDRVVPMLPERLSNGVCSLRPNEDKLCYSAVFTLDHNGKVEDQWFGRTVIHSNHRFTYEEAQTIIESNGELSEDEVDEVFLTEENSDSAMDSYGIIGELMKAIVALDKTAKRMRKTRGSLDFDGQEVKFILDENGKPIDIMFKVQKDANKLIEEYMLLANKRVAKFLNDKKVPMVNRVHDEPDPVKLNSLKDFIIQFGYTIDISDIKTIKISLAKLLADVKGSPEENIINNLVIRTMKKAEYSTENIGHYGLGFTDYGHFTSPIRRYPDVMLHRILDRQLAMKQSQKISKLEPKCKYLSAREVTAQKASRDSVKFKQCEYLQDKIGKVYKGVINSIQNYGVFVSIPENGCEGLVRLSDIDGDTFIVDNDNHRLVGYNTGEVIKLGDEVTIIISSVDVEKKNINLQLIRL